MADKYYLAPAEIAEYTVTAGQAKAASSAPRLLVLGLMAGAYVALASNGSTMVAHNLLLRPEVYGLGRALAGAIFGAALMMVVVAGGELFTGNTLILMGVLDKKVKLSAMLRNWVLVYVSNFVGSLMIAAFVIHSNTLGAGANAFGGMTIRIAAGKTGMTFVQALMMGIMCNMLVAGAVWMSYGAKDIGGKLLSCFFIIWLFAASGYEHCVANMFYVPVGIWAAENPAWLAAAGLSESALAGLNWGNFLVGNLVPVTIGNIIGGGGLIGAVYWFSYIKCKK